MNGHEAQRLLGTPECARGKIALTAAVLFAFALFCAGAHAATFRYANQGDALSVDPHSLNEGLQLSTVSNVYEGLVARGPTLELTPSLATDWRQTSPTTWRFNLRQGVTFHDGTPFTADDVIYSWQRSRGDGSDMKAYVQPIAEIRRSPPAVLCSLKAVARQWLQVAGTSSSRRSPAAVLLCDRETSQRQLSASVANG